MEIRIDEGLRAYIDPLTEDESAALERSLLAEGCRDALVLWGDLLIDGHNRYALCRKHNIPFETRQNTSFKSIEDVYLWMIENHLGRRSVSDFQRGVLALRKREILQSRSTPPWDEGARAEGDESVPTAASHAGGDAEGDGAGPKPVVMSQAQGRAELSRQALARGAHQQQHAGPDREDPEGSRAGTGAGRQGRDLHQRGRRRGFAAAGTPGGSRHRTQGTARGRPRSPPGGPRAREAPPEVPVEEIEDLPAEVTRLRAVLARVTEERDQLKKKVANLTVALSEARKAGGGDD